METVASKTETKNRLLIKALIIGGIVLVLQIPTYLVQNLVSEREERQKEATTEVSSKWAGKQTIIGPIFVLPYWNGTDSASHKIKYYAYFLPDQLTVNSSVTPQERYRGIYKVMLYHSSVNLSGFFSKIDPDKLKIPKENIIWNEAFVKMNVSDKKGLNDEMILKWKNRPITLSPNSIDDPGGDHAFYAPLNLAGPDDAQNIQFSSDFSINGTEQLLFTPIGKSTTVNLKSSWPHPSFTGQILPYTADVRDNGFSATWKSLDQTRNFPQQWSGSSYFTGFSKDQQNDSNINAASFGANLFVPVNSYSETMRSVKYAILCILLTFAAFFLIEITNRKSVHPFQYGLIGVALVLFYTLLLSFSEYIGFSWSYAVASVLTIGLISWFVKGVLASAKSAGIMSTVLMLVYLYVFTILRLEDYALLLGSLGLFLTLGIIMYFSKKIQWNY